MLKRTSLLVVIAAALVAPADALAVDHVRLTLKAANVAKGWTLSGSVTGGDYAPRQIVDVSVTLSRRHSARAVERHTLFATQSPSRLSFDGQTGRWQAPLRYLEVALTITVTGEARAVGESRGCRGAFLRAPVRLDGTFVLRTGTGALGAIRRARLSGFVTYNPGGPLDCGGATATVCDRSATLSASSSQKGGTGLLADRVRGFVSLSFYERGWYHVIELSSVAVLSGGLPRLVVRLPRGLPLRGSGTFRADWMGDSLEGSCRSITARGTFTGTLTATFSALGERTFAVRDIGASYIERIPM